ncbi:MAG: heme-binding protein [Burkholderiaceae bacterium]
MRFMKSLATLLSPLLVATMASAGEASAPSQTGAPLPSLAASGLQAVQRAVSIARDRKLQVSVACVDTGGNLVAFARTDDATLISVDTAIGKAYTAIAFRTDTATLYRLTRSSQALAGLEHVSREPRNLVMFPGGVLVRQDGYVVGAIGVSGAPNSADDDALAQDALR